MKNNNNEITMGKAILTAGPSYFLCSHDRYFLLFIEALKVKEQADRRVGEIFTKSYDVL
jgi:hypothetical protein